MSSPHTPEAFPTSRYVPDPEETVALLISLTCITLMSVLFGRKTAGTKLSNINYARGLVISLYLVSWTFSFIATHLVQTNNYNNVSCTMSIYTCILLYAASKIIIYLFLMEKVYVVTAVGLTRKNFMLYKVNMVLMVPYLGIVALMIIYRVAEIGQDGHCRIGLLKPAALPLILYDMVLSIWLTLLFIRPLMSSKSMLQGPSKGKLRDVARRTLIGAIVAMILSSANVFTLVYFQGYERGLICLSSCTADVTLNAITIHWVTSRATQHTTGAGGSGVRGHPPHQHRLGTGASVANEKHFEPADSHITVEAYVEEYYSGSHTGSHSYHGSPSDQGRSN
ncbi:hypothetical protein BGZ67_006075 [Mortierella alpina]|nr:hypothetical protein BGZ67_006075 [Mortierella alpina]